MFKYRLGLVASAIFISSSTYALDLSSVSSAYSSATSTFNSFSSMYSNSYAQNIMSSMSSSGTININDLVTDSKLPFELECDPDTDINFGSLMDICSGYDDLTANASSALSLLRNGFNFSGCSVKANSTASCRNKTIKDICSTMKSGNVKTIFGTDSSSSRSKENMLYSGGDVYLKGNLCESDVKTTIGQSIKYGNTKNENVETDYLSPSIVTAKNEAGGTSALWKPGKLNLYETCIKNALSQGKSDPEGACKGEFFGLPATRLEAEEQVARSSKVSLKSSTAGIGAKVSDVEKMLKASSYPQCTQVSNGECTDSSYVSNVKNNMDGMIKAEEMDRIKQTEEEMANFQEHVKIATMPKYEITYPTQEVLNGLHPEQKADFVVISNKQMHQEALFNSSIQNLTDLKKELIEISFKKAELSSKTFYPNVALAEAQSIMANGY